MRLAAPQRRTRPGRHTNPPRSRHRATASRPGSGPAFGLAASVLILTFAIGGVHADLNTRQEQLRQATVEQQARSDSASTERLSAQANQYASARHALALDTALTAMQDAEAVVIVAADLVDAEVVSPLDQAVAELAALIEVAAPAELAAPAEVAAPSEAPEPREPDGKAVDAGLADLASTSPPRTGGVTPDIPPSLPAPPDQPVTDLQVSGQMLELAEQVAELTGQVRTLADAAAIELAAAQAAAAEAAAAQAAADAAAAAERAAAELARKVAAADASPNGAIPHKLLCGVGFASKVLLRCDAANALEELNGAFRARFGHDLNVSSSYRDYSAQVATREARASLAAEPGTSNHGRGLAADFDGFGVLGQFDRQYYLWMEDNAAGYGWVHPSFMGPGGSGPLEPWHWEYGTH